MASEENAKIPPILQEGLSRRESFNSLLESIGLFGKEYAATREILTSGAGSQIVTKEQAAEYMTTYNILTHGRPILDQTKDINYLHEI